MKLFEAHWLLCAYSPVYSSLWDPFSVCSCFELISNIMLMFVFTSCTSVVSCLWLHCFWLSITDTSALTSLKSRKLCPAGGWVDLKVFAPLQKPPLPVGAGVPWVRVVNIRSVCSQYSAKVSDLKSNRNMYKEEKIFWLPPLCTRVWDCLTWSRRATWTPLYKHDCSFLYPPSLQIITRKYKLTFSLLHRVPPLSSPLECESSEL